MSSDEIIRQQISIIEFRIWLAQRDWFTNDYQGWCALNGHNPEETVSKGHYMIALKNKLVQLQGNTGFSPPKANLGQADAYPSV
jgi:hypothetical protein